MTEGLAPGGVIGVQVQSPRPAHRSRAEDVYEQIKRDISGFQLVPGDRFTEQELCDRLGVSRTPVRQALFRLRQEGFVDVVFRSGWRVLPFDFEQFDQLYDLRMVLEITALERICGDAFRVDREPLRQLASIWHAPEVLRSTEAAQVAQWDEQFHCALVAAAGNAEMARVHREVTERIRIIRRLDFLHEARIAATYEEHGQILRAIERRRTDDATRLLRSHIAASQAEVRKITLHQVYTARARSLAQAVPGKQA